MLTSDFISKSDETDTEWDDANFIKNGYPLILSYRSQLIDGTL